MTTPPTIDVLVVGAGPTGTTLAIDLVRRGLSVRIIDKAATSFPGSRAKGVQPRSLEVLQDLGAYDAVRAGGSAYPLLGIHLGPFVLPWRMIANRPRSTDVPFPITWLIPQFRTDRALHDALGRLGRTAEFNATVLDFSQDADGVTAKVSSSDGIEEIRARYLVGADGGGSAVRQVLGIGFSGSTHDEDRMIIVDAVTTGLSRDRWHVWPGAAGRFVGACPLPHSDLYQWIVRLEENEKPDLDEAAINARIQKRIRDKKVKLSGLQWTSVFRPNIRLADSYRRGRVFLAGDAAHVHPPTGAQGLNTGIQDAYNLGWKLAQVLSGANPHLLDSYEAERRPIAAAVLALSMKKYDGLAQADPSSIKRGRDETQLAITYRGGVLAPDGHNTTRTLHAGDRAPDAELVGPGGQVTRLFDLFQGPQFTSIAFGRRAAADLERLKWPTSGAPLRRLVIDVKKPQNADYSLKDASRTFRKAYGISGDTLLLIRPDGYVAHIATGSMLPSTQAAADRLTPPRA